MNLPDNSEVERLRLQLHHAELQRDAFKAMASGLLDGLIREALVKQVKPAETDWASLAAGYYTYDPKDSAPVRQDDKVTMTYTVEGKQVTKEQYDIAKLQSDFSALDGALDSILDRLDRMIIRVADLENSRR